MFNTNVLPSSNISVTKAEYVHLKSTTKPHKVF